ncbi:hypothetical protein Tco_0598753 [Tanacetum coccineum]
MKKVHILLLMTEGDERKHVLDYTHVDLHYVEDHRKNLVNKFYLLKQELSLHKSELCSLKNTMSINRYVQNEVIRVNLENESLKDEISDFKKADESPSMPIPKITSNSESECETQEPLQPLPKLIRATPANSLISLADLTLNMADLTLNTFVPKSTKPTSDKVSPIYAIKKNTETKSPIVPITLHLYHKLGVQSLSKENKPLGLDLEHLEQTTVNKTLTKLKAQSSVNPSAKKALMIPNPFKEFKYYGFNDHYSDNYEYYHGFEVCGSVAYEIVDCLKKHPNSKKLNSGCSRHMTGVKQYLHRYSKESGPKVVFGDNSSGDTEGHGSINCTRINFTRTAYVNGLKHNLISISQLCDANFKVLFTKTQGTILNQNDEVVLIAPRRRDVYVIDMYLVGDTMITGSSNYMALYATSTINCLDVPCASAT